LLWMCLALDSSIAHRVSPLFSFIARAAAVIPGLSLHDALPISIGGGWLSSALIKRGWTVNRARKTALLAMALLIVPTAPAPSAGSMWTAVLIVSVAAAAHQAWSANVYTLASDMFPRAAVGSVV